MRQVFHSDAQESGSEVDQHWLRTRESRTELSPGSLSPSLGFEFLYLCNGRIESRNPDPTFMSFFVKLTWNPPTQRDQGESLHTSLLPTALHLPVLSTAEDQREYHGQPLERESETTESETKWAVTMNEWVFGGRRQMIEAGLGSLGPRWRAELHEAPPRP